MTAHSLLFGADSDWLAHTLAKAGQGVEELEAMLPDGTVLRRLGLGILECRPANRQSREVLIVSAGIHGNETAPIEILNDLVTQLVAGEWQPGCPLLLVLGNPEAMVDESRFTELNLNRLFNGAHAEQSGGEPERARLIEESCRHFAAQYPGELSHYDLHTAIRPSMREKFALYPYADGKRPPREQSDFLLEADVTTMLLQHKKGTTFSSFTANQLGAESFTLELGKVRPFGQNDLSRYRAVREALLRRFRGQPSPNPPPAKLDIFEVVHEIINTGPSFRLHIPDDVANFTPYEPGTVIWEDEERSYRVGEVPESIVFPNRSVPVGQRAGLMVRPQRC
ncbi:succinylglutamate desuccinylase [Proteobacteria bacterium 005FR1]|nr:succinylglutamate desuccinylase [Proteobacteria bacterium 005FR1]